MFALTKSFDDESEVEEAKDEHIELLKSGEDSAETLEATEILVVKFSGHKSPKAASRQDTPDSLTFYSGLLQWGRFAMSIGRTVRSLSS